MPAELRNTQRLFTIDAGCLKKEIETALGWIGLSRFTVSLLLTDDAGITPYHERWMNEPGPTDVLSFPAHPPRRSLPIVAAEFPVFFKEPVSDRPPVMLGDIVISVETAARRKPKMVETEVRRYWIHGLLHLSGYDHRTAQQKKAMDRQALLLTRRVEELACVGKKR